jgi:hypothetical protein
MTTGRREQTLSLRSREDLGSCAPADSPVLLRSSERVRVPSLTYARGMQRKGPGRRHSDHRLEKVLQHQLQGDMMPG